VKTRVAVRPGPSDDRRTGRSIVGGTRYR